ncbi:MAG: hypothetical protein GX102_11305 [Porphyromonadaceae bacterium]|nr:hypothetical protein [Porphyromonadaceae bacterium]
MKHSKITLVALLLIMLFMYPFCSKKYRANKDDEPASLEVSNNNCLTNTFKNYGELLTISDIQAHYKLDAESVTINNSEGLGEYESCYYTWESDRTDGKSDANGVFNFPDKNQIGVKNLSVYDSDYTKKEILDIFQFAYKKLDDRDIEIISKNLEKEYSNKSRIERANAESLIERRKNSVYEKVYGVGDSAYWDFTEKNGCNLVVLRGYETFTVHVKISLNADENLELAKKLALTILAKCEG